METILVAKPIARAFQILEIISQNRGVVYRLLALGFTYPDEMFKSLIQTGAWTRELQNATTYLGEDQTNLLSAITSLEAYSNPGFETLQAEFTNLFDTGIFRISPREYAYRWKDACNISQSMSDLQQALQHQYNTYGVHCEPGSEDHITVELEYLAFLCDRESINWSQGYSKAARDIRSHERAFVDDHLARWLPEFCYRVCQQAPQSFYSNIAQFCDLWLCLDHGSGYVSSMANL